MVRDLALYAVEAECQLVHAEVHVTVHGNRMLSVDTWSCTGLVECTPSSDCAAVPLFSAAKGKCIGNV